MDKSKQNNIKKNEMYVFFLYKTFIYNMLSW